VLAGLADGLAPKEWRYALNARFAPKIWVPRPSLLRERGFSGICARAYQPERMTGLPAPPTMLQFAETRFPA